LEPKSSKPKAAKSEADSAPAEAPAAAPAKEAKADAPAKAALLLLETEHDVFPKHEYRTKAKAEAPGIESVTFKDKKQNCT